MDSSRNTGTIVSSIAGSTVIIEAGGTKTNFALIRDGEVKKLQTAGINLATMPPKHILDTIGYAAEAFGEACFETRGKALSVSQVRYYGAGLVGAEAIVLINNILRTIFPEATIVCGSDLLAAAKAGLGDEAGIVTILGTGSNSAAYDGHRIVKNIRPGGYILGDEGGAAALGKAFLADVVKGLLPADIQTKFDADFGFSYADIVGKVYREASPAAFLGSFAPWLLSLKDHPYVASLILENLRAFVERSLSQYELEGASVAVIGSFGLACREFLQKLSKDYGFTISRFVQDPIDELIEYEKR